MPNYSAYKEATGKYLRPDQREALDDHEARLDTLEVDTHAHANQEELDLVSDGDHDARTDNPHATDIGNLGSGTIAELNVAIDDATLDDSGDPRTPSAHASDHQSGGGDAIKIDDLASPDDNTDLDVSTSVHGLCPKLPNDATRVLGGTGSWQSADLQPYAVKDGAGDQSIDGTERTLNLDTEDIANGNYSLASDQITVTDSGTYQISYIIYWDTTDTSGGSQHLVEGHCEKVEPGPTISDIPLSAALSYGLEITGGAKTGSCGTTFLVELDAGDAVRVRMERIVGTTNIDTRINMSGLSIIKVSD